jgi:hypothetical protein
MKNRIAQFEAHTVSSRSTTDILAFISILVMKVCTGLFLLVLSRVLARLAMGQFVIQGALLPNVSKLFTVSEVIS